MTTMSRPRQLCRPLRCVAPEHRYVLPAHEFKNVAVVHPRPLHVHGCAASEGMDGLVLDARDAAESPDNADDARGRKGSLFATPQRAFDDCPPPRISFDRLER